jgi:Ca2+-dependent lipid-binding protein
MGVVTVFLDKIRHLRDEDTLGRSDPYVIFELEKDNWVFDKTLGEFRSSKKDNDCNPEYAETFTFENVPSVENMILHVKVYDDDVGRDDLLGSCHIQLEKLGLSGELTEVEKVIDNKKGEGFFSRKARIFLKLSFTE